MLFKRTSFSLLFLSAYLMISSMSLASSTTKTIVVVHSYALDYEWTAGIDSGVELAFENNFGKTSNWKLERVFLDGKKKLTPEEIAESVEKAKIKIQSLKPDAAILMDDLAFTTLYGFLHAMDIPISFGGINGNLSEYGFKEKTSKVSGSLERYNVPAVLKMMKRLRPSINKILLVADVDITGHTMLKDFLGQINQDKTLKKSGITEFSEFTDSSFEKLKEKLSSVDPKTTGVFFVAYFTYKKPDGSYMPYQDIDRWVVSNTKFIDSGIASFNLKGGRLLSLGSSEKEIGFYSANLLFKSLKSNRNLAEFPIRRYLPLQLGINHQRAKQLGVSIPFDILAYASTSSMLYEKKVR